MSKEFPLDGLALEIKQHWAKYRPRTYRELEREGRLDQSLHEASEKTGQAFGELVEGAGSSPTRRGRRSARSGRSCGRSPGRSSKT